MSTTPKTSADWHQLSAGLALPTRPFIDGDWAGEARTTFDCVSPRDGRVIAQVTAGGDAEVDAAVRSARTAFEDGRWSRLAPAQRKQVMSAWADRIEAHADELAVLIALEMGKPISDCRGIEVPALLRTIRWYAEITDKLTDELPHVAPPALAMVTREPVGVVGAIVPWNFPLTMAGWKLGPALATGNSVVLKPAEQSPLSALRLAQLAADAGLPDGVLNVVPGLGPDAGQALGRHPDVDVLTFTGSAAVGRQLLHYAADTNLKTVWLELGGKSPNIVFADAPDLGAAADMAAWGIFFNSGEMCTAASRLLVQRDIHDEFLEAVVQRAGGRRVGDPLDPQSQMGPVVSAAQMARVLDYVDVGRRDGATLCHGGGRVREDSGGFYVQPTVFADVDNDMRIAREEIFGPVLAVIPFDDAEDAIRIANDTHYGLAAAVWTADLRTAHTTARAIRAGTVWVNCYEEGDMTVPFGGMKQSGNGRDKSWHALDKFLELKTTWIDLS